MIMWKHSSTEIAKVIKDSLEEIASVSTWENVQGTTIGLVEITRITVSSAKEWCRLILGQGVSDDPQTPSCLILRKRLGQKS